MKVRLIGEQTQQFRSLTGVDVLPIRRDYHESRSGIKGVFPFPTVAEIEGRMFYIVDDEEMDGSLLVNLIWCGGADAIANWAEVKNIYLLPVEECGEVVTD